MVDRIMCWNNETQLYKEFGGGKMRSVETPSATGHNVLAKHLGYGAGHDS